MNQILIHVIYGVMDINTVVSMFEFIGTDFGETKNNTAYNTENTEILEIFMDFLILSPAAALRHLMSHTLS